MMIRVAPDRIGTALRFHKRQDRFAKRRMRRLQENETSTPIYKLPIQSCLSRAPPDAFEGWLEVSFASFLDFPLLLIEVINNSASHFNERECCEQPEASKGNLRE